MYQVLAEDMTEMKQYIEQYAMIDASRLAKEKKEAVDKTEAKEEKKK